MGRWLTNMAALLTSVASLSTSWFVKVPVWRPCCLAISALKRDVKHSSVMPRRVRASIIDTLVLSGYRSWRERGERAEV